MQVHDLVVGQAAAHVEEAAQLDILSHSMALAMVRASPCAVL